MTALPWPDHLLTLDEWDALSGSNKQDRVMKPVEYAEAGIPHYWLVDIEEPATLTAYLLVDGSYEIVAQVHEEARLSEPAPVTVDVRKLTARR